MSNLQSRLRFGAECVRNFVTTGSLIPSSRFLSRTMAQYPIVDPQPRVYLEVGSGTGPITIPLIERLRPEDRLVAVELQADFCALLRREIARTPALHSKSAQITLVNDNFLAMDLSTLRCAQVVCSLPFNNFPPDIVTQFFERMLATLIPGGTLLFFEYIYLRALRQALSIKEREQLSQTGNVLNSYTKRYGIAAQPVLLNFPPAMVYVLQRPVK